jgi:hypothetical protein
MLLNTSELHGRKILGGASFVFRQRGGETGDSNILVTQSMLKFLQTANRTKPLRTPRKKKKEPIAYTLTSYPTVGQNTTERPPPMEVAPKRHLLFKES